MAFLVVIFVLAALAVGIVVRPVTIMAFAFGVYCFEQWAQANSGFFGSHAAFINLAFGILTLFSLLIVAMRGKNPLNPLTGASLWFVTLYCYAAVSCMWSLDRELSLFLFKYYMPYMVTFVILLPLVLQEKDDVHHGFVATLVFCSVVMMMLLTSTTLHAYGRTIEAEIVNRVGKTQTRLAPLAIADMAGQVLIIAMLMNFRGVHRIWQQLRWPIVILALVMIFRSASRGQFIASLLTILILIAFSRGTKSALGWITASVSTALIAGIATVGFLSAAETSKRWDVESMQNAFSNTRLSYTATLLQYWAESSPINWFIGLGCSASFDPRVLGRYCHMIAAEVLAELGFIGMFIFCGFIGLIIRDAFRLYQMTKNDDVERGVSVTLIGLFMFTIILSFKQGSFISSAYPWCFGLLISRHAAIVRSAQAAERSLERQKRWRAWYQWQQQAQQHQQLPQPQT